MKKIYFYMLFFSLPFSFTYGQTIVVLPASQDNTIYGELTNNSNGAGDNFTVGTIVSGNVRRGLIKFDLSSIPAGSSITAVSLRMVMNKTAATAPAASITLHRLNASWGEGASAAASFSDGQGVVAMAGDATWLCSFADGVGGCSSSWAAGGNYQASASATSSVNGNNPYTWSSAQAMADVQGWVNSAGSNYGWLLRSDEVIFQTAKRFSSRTNPVIADRPTLTVTYNSLIPVTLVYFKAQATRNGNILQWQTAQEINSHYFDIEHSRDGIHFISIGRANAAGNSSANKNYSFTHNGAAAGKHFYRLVQADFDGRKNYSAIEMVVQKNYVQNILINPTPVADKIMLPGINDMSIKKYIILNVQAQKLAEDNFTGNSITLNSKLSAGIYCLRIWLDNGVLLTGSFIKN